MICRTWLLAIIAPWAVMAGNEEDKVMILDKNNFDETIEANAQILVEF